MELRLFAGNDGHQKRKGVDGRIRAVGCGVNCACISRWKVLEKIHYFKIIFST
jgi:hypothetical protein